MLVVLRDALSVVQLNRVMCLNRKTCTTVVPSRCERRTRLLARSRRVASFLFQLYYLRAFRL